MKRFFSIVIVLIMIFSMLIIYPASTAYAEPHFSMSFLGGMDHYFYEGEDFVDSQGIIDLPEEGGSSSGDPYLYTREATAYQITATSNETAYLELRDCAIWNADSPSNWWPLGGWYHTWISCIIVESGATLYLKVTGNNYLYAGDNNPAIEVQEGGALIIYGEGNLYCLGGPDGGAGIGEEPGETAGGIAVRSSFTGNIFSVGRNGGAGIGSSEGGSFTSISILGGQVYAFGGKTLFDSASPNYLKSGTGAGIGSGLNAGLGAGQFIQIGGTAHVEAYGGDGAAGIGTGHYGGITGAILISGNPFIYAAGCQGGAGIGTGAGGRMADGGFEINCGTTSDIQAYGSLGGAGIGTGQSALTVDYTTCDINILGGNIYAQGGSDTGSGGPGIGFGAGGGQPNFFMLLRNSNITAIGGNGAAGIGGGSDVMAPQGPTAGRRGAITIASGNIYAKGTAGGAGIGGGVYAAGGFVEIWSGIVYADGGPVDIGGGDGKDRGILFLDHSAYTPNENPPVIFLKHGGANYPYETVFGETSLKNAYVVSDGKNTESNTIFGVRLPGGLNVIDNSPTNAIASLNMVTFDSNEGTSVPQHLIAKGGEIITSPNTTNGGRIFEGWFTDNTTFSSQVVFPYSPTTSTELYAKWGSIPVTDVTISSDTEKLILGDNTTSNDTVDIDVTVLPNDADNQDVAWASDDTSVATVDDNGIVTAQSAGTTTITVTADDTNNGTLADSCIVTVEQGVTDVALSSNAETLNPTQSVQLTAAVSPDDATYPTIMWTSNNTSVATVDYTGKVTAIANGTAVIDATAGIMTTSYGQSDQCIITVETPVSGVSLNTNSQTIEKGETYKLEATVNPQEASYPTVTWISGDVSIATVGQDGLVTAVSDGNAIITASADGKSATCDVMVRTSVQSITLSETSLSIRVEDKHTLAATVNPSDATYPTVTWTSSDIGVATVNQSGEVIAVGAGNATITAQADGISAQCTISTITPVTGVVLSSSFETVDKGRSFILTATVNPSNATNKIVSWQSSDNSVATVDQNGNVTAVGKGTAAITATADGKKSSCSVKVVVYVINVNISNASVKMNKGDTYTLSADVSPNDASDKSITWMSSNTAVASVSQSGVVTANGKGTAVITATVSGKSNTCNVTVEVPVVGVTISNTTLSMDTGDTTQLSAAINPGDATNQSISWQSSDVNVVTVNSSGLVQAIGSGNTTVSASIDGKTATCAVIVSDATKEDSAPEVSSIPFQEVTPTPLPTAEKIIIATTPADADDKTGIITLEIDISNFPDNTVSIMLPDGKIISINEAVNGMLSISIGVDELNSNGELEIVIIDDSEVAFGSVITQVKLDDEKTVWPFILAGFLGLLLVAGSLMIRTRQTSISRQRSKRQR